MKNLMAFALLWNPAPAFTQTTELNLASDIWPPFTDVAPNHAFALDLVKAALSRDTIQVKIKFCVFKDVLSGIENRQYDGSAALWRTPEREQTLLFSDAYLENRLILVGKKGSNVSARSLADLAGKRIAIVESYAYGSIDDARKVKFLSGVSDQQNLERVLSGQVDYMLTDALLIEYVLQYQAEEANHYLEIGSNTIMRLPLCFAIRKDIPGANKLMQHFNEEIARMIADGTYNQILQLNWLATDIDGDGQEELVLSGDYGGTNAPQHSYGVRYNPGKEAVQVSRYVVNGNLYPTWEAVPDKYKQSSPSVSDADKQGFGTIFKF